MSVMENIDEKNVTTGPLTRIFQNPTARVLDQSILVGNMEQTVPMLTESTDLAYKTVAKEVKRLVGLGLMERSRKVGNAQTYRFKVGNHLSSLISCAQSMQIENIREELEKSGTG
jgi:predicted transcriptional regulator